MLPGPANLRDVEHVDHDVAQTKTSPAHVSGTEFYRQWYFRRIVTPDYRHRDAQNTFS